MHSDPEARLASSWEANAAAWIRAVRDALIPSRSQATDAAIVQAVLDAKPVRACDLGCGEGWLARSLAQHGIDVVGVDASEALIASARAEGGADFRLLSYADIIAQPTRAGAHFDAVVSNFALLQQDVTPLLGAVRSLLAPRGVLVIQTVHPWTLGADRYEDRWMEETFETISDAFAATMPWYYRTLASWTAVLRDAGYRIRELREPAAQDATTPLSLIIIADAAS